MTMCSGAADADAGAVGAAVPGRCVCCSNAQACCLPCMRAKPLSRARACNRAAGVEATLYASLMSLNNAAAGLSDVLGAGMMALFGITSSSFSHLSMLLLTCNLLNLLPLPLIRWVPDESSAAAAAAAAAAGACAGGGDVELPTLSGRPASPRKAAQQRNSSSQ